MEVKMKKEKGLNVLEIVTTKKIYTEEEQNTIASIQEDIRKLEDDEKVRKYLNKQKELEQAKLKLKQKNSEYSKSIKEKCAHPLFNMVCCIDSLGYPDYNEGCIECVLCGQIMNFNSRQIKELYKNKRLIAKYEHKYDYWEGRGSDEYKPSLLTSSRIRKYYYELFLKCEYLKHLDTEETFEDLSVEDQVWQYYCESRLEKSHKLTKSKKG